MNINTKPDLFSISMFSSVSLQEEERLNELLDVFENNEKLTPILWGNYERIRLKYNKAEIIEKVLTKKLDFEEVFLYRNKSIKYSSHFDTAVNLRPFFNLEVDKSMPKKYWQMFFELSDQIAEIVKPRYGVTSIVWTSKIPWENDRERLRRLMYYCETPAPVDFPNGPLGVGMRTYFSGDVLDLFGRDIFKNIPGVVTELDWGGIRVDLYDKPWEVDPDKLFDKWMEVMNYLESTQILAIPSFKMNKAIFFSPNNTWKNRT
jgi:hypothetical protein